MRRVTALFAHPDDETFATGATLARYADEGVRCSLYCATDGDAGRSSGIPVSSRAELGALRRDELREACAVIGVASVTHGGHPDGALASVDADVVIAELVQLVRDERPDVVLTFGPEGAPNGHRDHKVMSRLATAAFHLAGTHTAFPDQLRDGRTPHRAARLCYVTWPAGLEPTIEGQPVHVAIPLDRWRDRKVAAFEAHRTQHQHRASFEQHALRGHEWYFVASGVPVSGTAPCPCLFAGLP